MEASSAETESVSDGTLTVTPQIVELCEDVFCVNGVFRCAPGMRLPIRCTIIRLPGNKLVVYSAFNPSLVDISSLGTVHAIVVPNLVHWSYAHPLKELNPDAIMYSSPSVKARFPDRDWGTVIEDDKPFSISPGVEILCISRLKPFQELFVLHRPSKTLLMADIAFNWTDHALQEASTGARLYIWLLGGRKTLGNAFSLKTMMRPYCKDALSQMDKLMEIDWDAVIPCHGDVVESGAKEAFRANLYQFVKDTAENEGLQWTTTIGVAVMAVAVGVLLYRLSKVNS